jgi:hypothetical protein
MFGVRKVEAAADQECRGINIEPALRRVRDDSQVCSANVRCARRTAFTFFILFLTEGFVK